jgi:hypothetical protein
MNRLRAWAHLAVVGATVVESRDLTLSRAWEVHFRGLWRSVANP